MLCPENICTVTVLAKYDPTYIHLAYVSQHSCYRNEVEATSVPLSNTITVEGFFSMCSVCAFRKQNESNSND